MSRYFSWLFDAGEQRISTRIVELGMVVRRLEARFEAEAASRRDDLNRLSALVEQVGQATSEHFEADAMSRRDDLVRLSTLVEQAGHTTSDLFEAEAASRRDDLARLSVLVEHAGQATSDRFEADAASRRDALNRLSSLVEQTGQAASEQAQALQSRLTMLDTMGRALDRWLKTQSAWLLDRANARRFPVVRTPDGQLLARLDRDERPPVAVISIPKAGTYLVGLLLERLGYRDTELHISPTFLTDYRALSIAEKRGSYENHTFALPIDTTAMLVAGGQFVVGHLPYMPATHRALAGFRKLFLHRNLVDATISHLRFLVETRRLGDSADWVRMEPSPDQLLAFLEDKGAELFEGNYRGLMGWLDDPEVFAISFDTLAGGGEDPNRAERLRALAAYLGCDQDLGALLDQEVIGQPTKTLSKGRTQIEPYVDERVREAFRALDVDAFNARLGYGPI